MFKKGALVYEQLTNMCVLSVFLHLLTQLGSHGFCLLNNVAIGAAYARCVHRSTVKKVAIIDFDVHHGNGTEALIRNVEPSIHEEPFSTPFSHGSVTTPMYKPWLNGDDLKNVFFTSIHGYGRKVPDLEVTPGTPWFYPASGETSDAVKSSAEGAGGAGGAGGASGESKAGEQESHIYNVRW